MNFSEMQSEVADRLGAFDESISADATKISRWLNMAQQAILGMWDWDFLDETAVVQTTPDYTTGTVNVFNSSELISFSAGFSYTIQDRYIQFSSSDDWYEIYYHPAGYDVALISPAYSGDTATGLSYTIRKTAYLLTTSLVTINSVKISAPSNNRLISLPKVKADRALNFSPVTGTPTSYYLTDIGLDSFSDSSRSGMYLSFYPNPDAAINIYVSGKKDVANLSSTVSNSLIPFSYQTAIVDLATYYGAQKIRDYQLAKFSYESAMKTVETMKNIFALNKGEPREMRAFDDNILNPGPLLPQDYGVMSDA